MSENRERFRLSDALAPGAVVLLLFAGYIKGSPAFDWLPIDLTLLAAVLVAVGVAAGWLGRAGRLPRGFGWVAVLVALLLVPVAYASDTEYGSSKTLLLALTLLSAIGPMFLVNTQKRLWWFVSWVVIGGLIATLLAQFFPDPLQFGRTVFEGGGTIGVGRATGAALMGLLVLVLTGRLNVLLALTAATPLLYALIGSGSRGPIVAVGLAALMTTSFRRSGHRFRDSLVVGLGGLIGVVWTFSKTNSQSQQRILLLFAEDQGTSIDVRYKLIDTAFQTIWAHPFGLGWGGFEQIVFPLSYPHNIVLEVFAEAGWMAGAVFMVAVAVAFARAVDQSWSPAVVGVVALLSFYFVNALISGDINDNRAFIALLGLALSLKQTGLTAVRVGKDDEVEYEYHSRRPTDATQAFAATASRGFPVPRGS